MTTEIWIDSDYLTQIWDTLDKDKLIIRSVFNEQTKEYIRTLYAEIKLAKIDGYKIGKSEEKQNPKGGD